MWLSCSSNFCLEKKMEFMREREKKNSSVFVILNCGNYVTTVNSIVITIPSSFVVSHWLTVFTFLNVRCGEWREHKEGRRWGGKAGARRGSELPDQQRCDPFASYLPHYHGRESNGNPPHQHGGPCDDQPGNLLNKCKWQVKHWRWVTLTCPSAMYGSYYCPTCSKGR